MQLAANPIVLSGMRLSRRGHLVAAVIVSCIAALLMLMNVDDLVDASDERRLMMGASILSTSLVLQALVLVIGGAVSVARSVQHERESGLLEANRLTPMTPTDLLLGYWLGPQGTTVAASVPLAVAGLVATVLGGVPVAAWLIGQALLVSTALFASLMAALFASNATTKRATGGIVGLLGLGALWSASMGPILVTNYLLPSWPLFSMIERITSGDLANPVGDGMPYVLTAIGLQATLAAIAWPAARRAIAADSTVQFDARWLVVAAWTVVIGGQVFIHQIGPQDFGRSVLDAEDRAMLVYVMGGMLGLVGLAMSRPALEDVRRRALRAGGVTTRWMMGASSLPVAVAFGALLTVGLAFVGPEHGVLLAGLDATLAFVLAASLLELGAMRLGSRATGAFVVAAVLLVVAPPIAAAILDFEALALVVPGSIGGYALVESLGDVLDEGMFGFVVHIGLAVAAAAMWLRGVGAWTSAVNHAARNGQSLPTG